MTDLRRTVLPLMLLGDGQVGKTSLILTLMGNKFNDSQLTTVGKESYIQKINLHGNDLKMKIWDTAGQERFKCMSLQVIKTSDAVILVYAVTDKTSFLALDMWLSKLNETCDLSKKPIIIIGNKCDEENDKRQVTYEEGSEYAKKKGYNFYETSAKTGQNVKEAFNDIFEQLYSVFEEEIVGKKKYSPNGVSLIPGSKEKKKRCCK